MLLQGLYVVFYKAFTRLLQGLHKGFTMCVTRFLQGVYKVVYKAFTVCFTGFDRVCECHEINWIFFRGRSPVYTSRFVSDLRHISENTFKYFGIPHQAVKLYLYLFMEHTQKVEW
jgi:hypothetical protein